MNRLILNGFDDARKFNFINEIVLIDNEHWEEVPQNQLIVYKDGKIVYEAELTRILISITKRICVFSILITPLCECGYDIFFLIRVTLQNLNQFLVHQ